MLLTRLPIDVVYFLLFLRVPLMFFRFAFFILCLSATLMGASTPLQETPLNELDALIASTEELVQKQKTLRDDLQVYISLRDVYLKDPKNKELLLKTARIAQQSLERIKNEKLTSLFDQGFISEMTLFAKLAGKPSIPKIE